ncbi:uncharacterized protein LOC143069685 isoform X1 [Mytilus galloprovincialis]|uniref:uncharacterized protein LOC143069685 isoform X1 n=1 Tax=Mytilus galloprovincialis TaxID=29158 RepID=UPI003F7B6B0D
MASVPTTDELKKLKVVELKQKLTELGLSTQVLGDEEGLKADLIARLHEHYVEESQTENDEDEDGTPMQENGKYIYPYKI